MFLFLLATSKISQEKNNRKDCRLSHNMRLLEDLYYFTILLLYYLVKVKWVKIYQCTCVYIGIVHLYIKSDFYHLTFFIPFYHPELWIWWLLTIFWRSNEIVLLLYRIMEVARVHNVQTKPFENEPKIFFSRIVNYFTILNPF